MTVEVNVTKEGKYFLFIDGKLKPFQELREWLSRNETNKKKK